MLNVVSYVEGHKWLGYHCLDEEIGLKIVDAENRNKVNRAN